MQTRVARSAAAIGALVGLASAGTAAVLLHRLEVRAEDARLADVATVFSRELEAPNVDVGAEASDEAAEVAPLGIALAVYSNGTFLGGVRDLPLPAPESCATYESDRGRTRACAFGPPSKTIVTSSRALAHRDTPGVLLVAVGAASLLAALLAAIASWFAARWALAPLASLRRAIAAVPVDEPRKASLGDVSDSSDVEELRESVRELLDRLGAALEASRTFGANAAHELRTPLATMMAELDLLQADDRAAVARIRRSVARLSVLVDRLLALSQPVDSLVRDEAVALDDVVRDVIADRTPADQERIDVLTDAAGMVRGDEVVLRVVVGNVVDNALKFASDGRVTIEVAEGSSHVEVIVRDRGPGIDAGDPSELLAPFARGSDARPAGFGLGLAIAAHGARLHGGSLAFGQPEIGAEVHVRLPAWSDASSSKVGSR